MNLKRRRLVGGAIAFCGLLALSGRLAADLKSRRPNEAFGADNFDKALAELEVSGTTTVSDKIQIKVPDIAENGAVVPVSVSTSLDRVTRLSVLVENNPLPLTSSYEFYEGAVPYVSTRIKMLKTSHVVVLVEADGKLYSASKEVKVTIGGCGG